MMPLTCTNTPAENWKENSSLSEGSLPWIYSSLQLHLKPLFLFAGSCPPTCSVSLHGVPDVAVKVIIASQQQAARTWESHRGDATDDVIVAVEAELLVCTQVEQPAGGVVRTRGEGATVGEELRRSAGEWMTEIYSYNQYYLLKEVGN